VCLRVVLIFCLVGNLCIVKMKKLTEQQQELTKKTGTARLIAKLVEAGWSEEEVEKLERPRPIKAWAETVATGKTTRRPQY
jgi:hypothetical protein